MSDSGSRALIEVRGSSSADPLQMAEESPKVGFLLFGFGDRAFGHCRHRAYCSSTSGLRLMVYRI